MSEPGTSITQPTTRERSLGTPPKPPARRVPVPLAAVAALLVVALLVGVFATLGHNRPRPGDDTTPTALAEVTETPTASPTQTSLKLPLAEGTAVTQLPGVPVVAPSDPQVIYEYADNADGVVIRRSDNGGATWGKFLLPNFTGFISAIELAVNPADAKNVFLRLAIGYPPNQPSPCASSANGARAALGGSGVAKLNAAFPASNSQICTDVYASSDGGANWTLVKLPVAGSLFQTGVTFTYDTTAFQAENGTLYGRVWQLDSNGAQTGDIRIVRTDDEGRTWSAADTSLVSQAPHICSFTTTANALFAVTSASNCWNWQGGARSVWESDARGGQWVRMGDLPAADAIPTGVVIAGTVSVGTTEGPMSALYALPGDFGAAGVSDIHVSTDGGGTWSGVPQSGLPTNMRPLAASQTILRDGSLVVVFGGATAPTGPNVTYGPLAVFSLRPGASAWQRVTPDATVQEQASANVANLYVSNTVPLTVTISIEDDYLSSNPTYTLLPFS